MFGFFKKNVPPRNPPKRFPPVPDWKPAITQPTEQIIERLQLYTNNQHDLAVFSNCTCVLLPDGLSDTDAEIFAKETLSKIFNSHPDMNPTPMKDGNVLVQYNHPALNLVLDSVAVQYWYEIESNHQLALATDEVLITPLGSNIFDDFGKKALFGRCFMFMDAVAPRVIRVVRRSI
ncbi:hypothetical protein SAMN03159382_05472 [Pseudomonas sp. NFACC23-1]|uniref:hypothetical protein n=1 Tax=unclassified Pseudomonas TaxID=196821 RepID=UPI0008862B71|nr:MULTISPECIES: hypothetical protein [unclassified Pseudomonas]SDB64678.1 hypothetical protein SAMN03159386_05456 [Pseudomonas sp. NFACC17-2]SEJ93883.1 hypothetical protein SAMN03159382_05472 [Pseudomonas sp. NFACC23-1]SFW92764.1 hypothetical protein SAMN05660640_05669 [Pseudomonas sp. NFACC16-2]